MSFKYTYTTLLFFFSLLVCSQQISFSGNVYGFLGDRVLLNKKASKNVSFEGPINGVKLSIKNEFTTFSTQTDIIGAFSFNIPKPGKYFIEVSHDDYSSVQLIIQYENSGEKTNYPGTSFILKKGDNSINNIGDLIITNKGTLTYNFNEAGQKKSSTDVQNSNKVLIEKSVSINNSSKKNISKQTPNTISKPIKNETIADFKTVTKTDSLVTSISLSIQSTLNSLLNDSIISIDEIKSRVAEYRKELVLVNPQSQNYELLLAQITNAENQIKTKELLIKTQEEKISSSNKKIIYLTLFCLFAIISTILLFKSLNIKKKHNLILAEKNKNINKINARLLSSIRYASIVQSGFFKDKSSLTKIFSDSFIFNQPKDYLSGDFYWFSHVNNHKIIAVSDCTGHGVPGALLSILGHNILENIINVRGIVQPSKILFELNKMIVSAFSNDTQVEYGIDITIISIKDGSNNLLFSGITNGLYHYSDNKIVHHKVTAKTIGNSINEDDLADQSISIKKGDCFYLLSDGYCDQFGEKFENIEKYNLKRMGELLREVSISSPFSNSESVVETEFNNWKGNKEQTDDVIVLGFKI